MSTGVGSSSSEVTLRPGKRTRPDFQKKSIILINHESILPKIFFIKRKFFSVSFPLELGHFIVIALFSPVRNTLS
jgi:hypothetical protein